MSHEEPKLFELTDIIAISRDPNLYYWLGRISDGSVNNPDIEFEIFDRLTEVLAKDHDTTEEIAERGILIGKIRYYPGQTSGEA